MMKCAWSLVLATLIAVPHVLNAQGFGLFSRKVATINRMLPPSINLKGK